MTNTYNTLNPLGSTSAKDLSDNASNFDEGMNSLSPSFYDRFKRRRETWSGMEKLVHDFLEAMGFEATHLVYVDGSPLTVLRPTQLIDRAGSVYKVKAPAVFPVMLTGTWATDHLLLVDVGDAALRMAIASSSGGGMVGVINPDGTATSWSAQQEFTRQDQSGATIDISAATFGIKFDGTDQTAKIQAIIDANPGRWLGMGGKTATVTSLLFPSGSRLFNARFKTLAGSTDFVTPITVDGRTSAKEDIIFYDVHVDGNRQNQIDIVSLSEDGGRNGFRILGKVTNLYLYRCSAIYCATDGISLYTAAGLGEVFPAFTNVKIVDSSFLWNRRHGGSLDGATNFTLEDCKLNFNGRDLDSVSPLDSGMRGARLGGQLYGNGWDFESYGIGTHITDTAIVRCEGKGNARGGLLILPSVNGYGGAGWLPFSNFTIIGGSYDWGVDPSSEGHSITCVGLSMTTGMIGITDLTMVAVHSAKGLKIQNTAQAKLQGTIDNPYSGGFLGVVVDSSDIELDFDSGFALNFFVSNSSVAYRQKFVSAIAPSLNTNAAATITSQTTTLMSSSRFTGSVYKIAAVVSLTGLATSAAVLNFAGGRTVKQIIVSAGTTGAIPFPITYFDGFGIAFKPGVLGDCNVNIYVTVF
jgi:hypothetical protein